MVHECLTDGGIDPSDIDTVMSALKAKSGKSSQQSSRKIKVHQRYVFARANQSTNHLVLKVLGAAGVPAQVQLEVALGYDLHWDRSCGRIIELWSQ